MSSLIEAIQTRNWKGAADLLKAQHGYICKLSGRVISQLPLSSENKGLNYAAVISALFDKTSHNYLESIKPEQANHLRVVVRQLVRIHSETVEALKNASFETKQATRKQDIGAKWVAGYTKLQMLVILVLDAPA